MAKLSAINKNLKRKKMINQYNKKRTKLLSVVRSKDLSFEEKVQAMITLSELPRNSSPSRYRNRCMVSGRPRGYHGDFAMSRIALRELGSSGVIPGLVKSSW